MVFGSQYYKTMKIRITTKKKPLTVKTATRNWTIVHGVPAGGTDTVRIMAIGCSVCHLSSDFPDKNTMWAAWAEGFEVLEPSKEHPYTHAIAERLVKEGLAEAVP
jgi:hypothetical protein